MTVGKKLWIGFLAILSIVLLVGASGLWALSKLDAEYRYLIDDKIKNVIVMEQLLSAQHADAKNIRGYIIYQEQSYVEQRKEILESIKGHIKELDQALHTPSARDIMKDVKETTKSAETISELIIRDVQAGNLESAMNLAMEVSFYQEEVSANLQQLIQQQETEQKNTEEQLQTVLKWIYYLIGGLIGFAVVSSIVIARIISRSIAKPVRNMTASLAKLANGDFTAGPIAVRNKDEIGEMATALNGMTEDLRGILTTVKESAIQLALHAEELSASSEESLAASETVAEITERNLLASDEQVGKVNDSNRSLNEMLKGIDQISDDNERMQHASTEVADLVLDGASRMREVTSQMGKISSSIQESSITIGQLAAHSEKIREVTSFITTMAEQTNLLALNAAIEAARAGEHGKGFAVVAEEVRQLADQSKRSAGHISQMIDEMVSNVQRTIKSSEESNGFITKGRELSERTGDVFQRIEGATLLMNDAMHDVSTKIKEVRSMTDIVSAESIHIQDLALQTSAEAQSASAATEEQLSANEEISANAQTLASLADRLLDDVNRFTIAE
ncbi:methyl-accepting chemotaxis protein [Sporosarcina sp. ACRSL]|uniref:methyl-accepting chemotaxis protein n=1 Tax=Sporosarcina sp. ACRSL TaxID=2918215 RepID=UPI001EF59FEC|nr:methyl-accepting chemotaxis protein [Sporosarcina sp. ACRSL]MCG7343184.1 methyl-accepting chemotaxis protein [Sporosarcina sp. ACRSL]